MIQSMRLGVSSWWAKLLLALIVFSFVFASFYMSNAGRQLSAGHVAEVNGHPISFRDVSNQVQNVIAFYQNMGLFKGDVPPAILDRLQNDVTQNLIAQRLWVDEAQRSGLYASEEEVRQNIQKLFVQPGQAFDFETYRNILEKRLGKTPAAFERDEGDRLLAQHFQNILAQTYIPLESDAKERYVQKNTQARLKYVLFDDEKLAPRIKVAEPSEEALNAFYTLRKEEFSVPESRDLRIVTVAVEPFISEPTSEDLSQTLSERFKGDEFEKAKGARFHASHILIKAPDAKSETSAKAKAQGLLDRLRKGASFSELARAHSEDGSAASGGDLGFFGEGAMVKEFEAAVKSLKPQGLSGLVKSAFGYHIILLHAAIPAGEVTVDRLKPELTYAWKNSILSDPRQREPYVAQAKAALSTSKSSGVEFKAMRLNSAWRELADPSDGSLIFSNTDQVAPGASTQPITSLSGRYVYQVEVLKKTPARQPELAEIRPQLLEKYTQEERRKSRRSFYDEILASAKQKAQPLEYVSKTFGLRVDETDLFARSDSSEVPGVGSSEELFQASFAHKAGELLPSVYVVGGKFLIAAVSERKEADLAKFESEKEGIIESLKQEDADLRQSLWLAHARKRADVQMAGAQKN